MTPSPVNKYRIGVLRGGPSREYNHSLTSGAHVLSTMPEKFDAHDIFIDKSGIWHYRGIEIEPKRALSMHDVIFNTISGDYGEDGRLHDYLDSHALRYTGSKSASSRLSWNKFTSKQFFDQHELKIPRYTVIDLSEEDPYEMAQAIFSVFAIPLVIKPVSGGASSGVEKVDDFKRLVDSLIRRKNEHVIIEEYIKGIPVSVGVVRGLRGEDLYSLIPIQIKTPTDDGFVDYNRKGEFSYSTLGRIDMALVDYAREAAQRAHSALGLRDYSRSDFILSPEDGVYLLETNSVPDLSVDSPFVYALGQSGISMSEFLEHTIHQALGH